MVSSKAILVCHSERSEESQFVIRGRTNRNIQRCFASLNMTKNSRVCEKLSIVAVPITLKAFSGIVLSLQVEKLFELRMARDDLFGFGELMIRPVITATAGYRQIDHTTKRASRRFGHCRWLETVAPANDA